MLFQVLSFLNTCLEFNIKKMRIVLISPYGGITNLGLRYLSSSLKRKNHQIKLVFLPRRLGKRGDFDDIYSPFSTSVLTDLKYLCRDAHLVGISVMTPYFARSVELAKFLKNQIRAPLVWGGIHPTVEPEECLKSADFVCIGEGEEALIELVEKLENGKDYTKTANFWFKKGEKIIRNPPRLLKHDLDNLPFPDYDLSRHYILIDKRIVNLNQKLLEQYLPYIPNPKGDQLVAYPIFCTRGCPHGCSYCCNNALRRLYPGQKYIRRRSVKNIIQELKEIRKKFPFIKAVKIEDDSFLVAATSEITDFAKMYKKEIGLPFICLSSPVNITEEKIASLVEAGMVGIQMGIQSGSDILNKNIFNRPISAKQILAGASVINKYQEKLTPPRYDIITDNPFETEKDLIKTIKILAKIPGKYILNLYSLVFYPGTALYKRAASEGLLQDKEETYRKNWLKIEMTYLKFLIFANRFSFFKIPSAWLKFLLAKQTINIGKKFNFLFAFLYQFIYFLRLKFVS